MNAPQKPPQMDPWLRGVRAADVPIVQDSTAGATPLEPDASQIEQFLADHIGSGLHLVSIAPLDGQEISGRYFGSDAGAAAQWAVTKNRAGNGLYFTVNITTADLQKKPTKKEIVAARFSHCDIDPPKGGGALDRDAVMLELMRETPPSLVIDSGNGLQPLWRLNYALTDQDAVEHVNQSIASRFGGDKCHNVDRLLRIPGTINFPNAKKLSDGRVPTMATLAHIGDANAIYSLAELAKSFPPTADKERERFQNEFEGKIKLLTPDDLELSQLSPLRSVIERPAGKDRSVDGLRATGDMLRAGYSKEQVLGVLLNPANEVSAHYMDQADPRRAALRTLEYACKDTKQKDELPTATLLQTVTPSTWKGKEPEEQRWLAHGRIPADDLTLYSGNGGAGKTETAVQLLVSVAGDLSDWLGCVVENGTALFISCEEDEGNIRGRVERICKHRCIDIHSVLERLHLYFPDLEDTWMVAADPRTGALEKTKFYQDFASTIAALKPSLVVIDSVAAIYGADAFLRRQVRSFLAGLRKLAKQHGTAIVLLDHPSVRGMSDGSGTANSVDWRNSVRSMLHLSDADKEDRDLRVLEVKKSNYGRTGDKVEIVWNGLTFEPKSATSAPHRARAEQQVDDLFLRLLDKFTAQGRFVRSTTGSGYAPPDFAKDPEAGGVTKHAFAASMLRLFNGRKIHVVKGNRSSRIERVKV